MTNTSLDNPWTALPDQPDFVLPNDVEAVEAHNSRVTDPNRRFVLDLLPEPFLGTPHADIVMLNLNPGFSEEDYAAHRSPVFSDACRRMLSHDLQDWPLYLLDPRFKDESGAQWWRKRLRALQEAVGGFEPIAHRMLVIELFGYHSRSFQAPRLEPPSVAYGVDLARQAMTRGAMIILMRARRAWLAHLPELADYPDLHQLKNPQSPYMSAGNCPTGFDRAVDLLRS